MALPAVDRGAAERYDASSKNPREDSPVARGQVVAQIPRIDFSIRVEDANEQRFRRARADGGDSGTDVLAHAATDVAAGTFALVHGPTADGVPLHFQRGAIPGHDVSARRLGQVAEQLDGTGPYLGVAVLDQERAPRRVHVSGGHLTG
jgi:hypothetical protein